MKKRYLPALLFAAILGCTNASAQTPGAVSGYAAEAQSASTTLTQRVDTWGDWNGSSMSIPTSVCYYYYDNANRLASTYSVVNMAGDNANTVEVEYEGYAQPNEYTTYHYDEAGHLTDVKVRKYGPYDGIFMGWSQDVTTAEHNEYDADGHLVYQRSTSTGNHRYSWDGNNLVEQTDTTLNKDTWSKTTVYSDFLADADNCPQTTLSVNSWKQMYQGKYTYDAQHRPISYVLWQISKATVDADHHLSDIELKDVPYSKQEWTYDEAGVATETDYYWNTSKTDYEPNTQVRYSTAADGSRLKEQFTWNAKAGEWSGIVGNTNTYAALYDGGTAPTTLTATLSETQPNSVILSASAPATAGDDVVWKVYRNGQAIGDATVTDGTISYTDSQLQNGTYSYFLQGLKGDKQLNVTMNADVTLQLALNAPTNLHVTDKKLVAGTQGQMWNVSVAWDAPQAVDGMTLRGYNVYADVKSSATNPFPDNFNTDAQVRKETLVEGNTYTFQWVAGSDVCHSFSVEAVYEHFGRVKAHAVALRLGDEPQRLLKQRAMYGDAMGVVEDQQTKRTDYYYDNRNNVIREVNRARVLGDDPNTPEVERVGDWKETSYTMYAYDAAGNLTSVSTREYKVQQGYKTDWTAIDTTNVYKYDDQNRRIEDHALKGYKRTTYAWDGSNLVGETQTNTYTGALIYDMQYRDFVEGKPNLPQTIVKDGLQESNRRVIEMTYDADGHMLTRDTYKFGDLERDADGKVTTVDKGTPDLSESWTYDADGDVTLYLKKKWNSSANDYQNASKTTYTKRADGIYEEPFTWSKALGDWSPGRQYLNVYADYFTNTAATDLTAKLADGQLNTVTVSVSRPTDLWDVPVCHVYRNGKLLGDATLNARRSAYTFTDRLVPNGTWDYSVVPEISSIDFGMNVPTPVSLTLNTDLPAVGAIKSTDCSKDADDYHLTLGWDEPDMSAFDGKGLELLGYSIYADVTEGGRLPAPENGNKYLTTPSYTFDWTVEAPATQSVMVEAVYNVGSKLSPIATFNADLIIAGINQASGIDGTKAFAFDGRSVTLPAGTASVVVADATGKAVASRTGAATISLTTLPKGVYVVIARLADGRQTATKVVLK